MSQLPDEELHNHQNTFSGSPEKGRNVKCVFFLPTE